MTLRMLIVTAFAILICTPAYADQAKVQSAISAGPNSLTKGATIMSWNGDVLREGTNG